jgi:hypothetical protein
MLELFRFVEHGRDHDRPRNEASADPKNLVSWASDRTGLRNCMLVVVHYQQLSTNSVALALPVFTILVLFELPFHLSSVFL